MEQSLSKSATVQWRRVANNMVKASNDRTLFQNIMEGVDIATLRDFGPLPQALARMAAGYGLGRGAGWLMNRPRAGKALGMAGALGGLGVSTIPMLAQYNLSKKPGSSFYGAPFGGQFTSVMGKSSALMSMGGRLAPSHLSAAAAMNTINTDPLMRNTPVGHAQMISAIQQAAGGPRGVFTTPQLIGGLVTAGLGGGVGTIMGKTLGAVFGLPESTQKTIGRIGMIGGLARGLGIWR